MTFLLHGVSVEKNGSLVLNAINFQDIDNENWLISGNSGSGKSTFLDVLAAKIFPSQGKFLRDKFKKIITVSRDYTFHRIAGGAYQYYQQRYNAYDSEIGPTVYELLQNQVLPIGTVDLKSVDLPPLAYSEEHLSEIAEKLRIGHLLNRKVTTLSNGETRRTLLAYWFLKEPEVILLDNPFSGLDVNSRNELRNILEEISNVQIFLIADIKDLPKNIGNVLILENGKTEYCGKISHIPEILKSSKSPKIPTFPNHKILNGGNEFDKAIYLRNVEVNYGSKAVLQDINWEVKKGERWAVLGPNGSGKSTLTSLITGDNPQSYRNEIYLFDKRRGSGESIWDIKQKIGFVSPELHLHFQKNISVYEAIGSGYFDTIGLFKKLNAEQEQLMDDYLDSFNLLDKKQRSLKELSSGQQRIVLLIRALVKNALLLILDEPCQGLDHNQMVYFRDSLDELVKSQNKTLIYISHYTEEIPACVNNWLYLEDGKIAKIFQT